jgi:VWFA-related protein
VIVQRLIRFAAFVLAGASAWAQAQPPTVIKTETKLVLVDVVVTNKKGQYVSDLEMKDFKVWEDNKQQTLKTFSYGPDPTSPDAGKRYIALFFDSMSLSPSELAQSRIAAQRFIETNAGPDRLILVAGFMNTTQIAQNFTSDIDKLKASLGKIQSSTILRGPEMAIAGNLGGMGGFGGETGMGGQRIDPTQDFAARSMLQGLRGLAKSLGEIPGRKSLILFTSGFPMSNSARDEATATMGICNRSNVAIYSVDARGMAGNLGSPSMRGGRAALEMPGPAKVDGIALAAWPVARIASFFFDPQARGGGTTGGTTGGGAPAGGGTGTPAGGGGTPAGGGGNPASGGSVGTTGGGGGRPGGFGGNADPGGGRTGGMPGTTGGGMNNGTGGGFNDPFGTNNPNNRRGPFGMEMHDNVLDRQQILYMLADGTGGFVILNTNDLSGGLEKIAKEQNSFYILGYTPPDSPYGKCPTLKVKVDRGGTTVRARAGYCNTKGKDVLAGSPVEKTLESRVTGANKGTIAASMTAPFFYTGANTARVAVTLEIPTEAIKFEKVKGKQHAAVNVLGIAYTPEGTVAARFSDVVMLDFETSKEVEAFKKTPMHYENQFDIASGKYLFKVVFDNGGEGFGKLESALAINAYDAKEFAMSAVALSKKFGPSSAVDAGIESMLLEGRSSLIAGNFKFTPSGYSRFAKTDNVAMYFEIYDPLLTGEKPPKVFVAMRFLDGKTGAPITDTGMVPVDNFVRAGSATVAAGLKLPVANLPPGPYTVEIKAQDSTGTWALRTADFEVMQ